MAIRPCPAPLPPPGRRGWARGRLCRAATVVRGSHGGAGPTPRCALPRRCKQTSAARLIQRPPPAGPSNPAAARCTTHPSAVWPAPRTRLCTAGIAGAAVAGGHGVTVSGAYRARVFGSRGGLWKSAGALRARRPGPRHSGVQSRPRRRLRGRHAAAWLLMAAVVPRRCQHGGLQHLADYVGACKIVTAACWLAGQPCTRL